VVCMAGGGKSVHMVTFILLAIGGILWGIDGLINWQINALVGDAVARIIYILVGLSAVYELATHKKSCKMCSAGSSSAGASSMGSGGMQ
jgi:uncharacterized membrane protein YuzA (DUF378 family)